MPPTNDDPRARRSRAAALAAATELLAEGGPGHITHAAVAARAKVGRATVYRHWPDLQALLLDTLTGAAHPLLTLGHGPVRDELVTHLQQQTDWLNRPVSASVIATVMQRAEWDPDIRCLRDEMFGRGGEHLTDALAAAVARGELRAGIEEHTRDLASRILGPLLFLRLMLGTQPDRKTVADTVDAALATWQPHK
ncbi:AcrR family transcriptional regulator [Streptomyces sp. SAI-144]|jgi:AcrR family transcriptional regulator|uniref:TetR/AcrR family transcriptional regulator n=1 Tax=unclassified Streptomyces TaxID=2593676 RepID=UPI0024744690|nr:MULTISPECIES: TetR/AcrR family transcriptional regulator [unclassified Streptomyces]MDH6437079.1 AcrR family transcriptional regulator [Streptomyces sp. SAI-144]MDH6484504.1 AcrR family transcriptional regulator [Streptomyces sp. SAI-127]